MLLPSNAKGLGIHSYVSYVAIQNIRMHQSHKDHRLTWLPWLTCQGAFPTPGALQKAGFVVGPLGALDASSGCQAWE
jgi:hypothetical protein